MPADLPGNLAASIHFLFASAQIDAAGTEKIARIVDALKANPKTYVTLVGFSDDLGSRAYNLAIVDQRMEAVAKLLMQQGVARHQIRRYGLGNETAPRYCRSVNCRSKMRRVDLMMSVSDPTGHD